MRFRLVAFTGLVAVALLTVAAMWNAPRAVDAVVVAVAPASSTTRTNATPTATAPVEPLRPPVERAFASTSGRPVDLEGDTVAAFADRMAPQARRGDAVAAYRVYQAEALCGSLERERRAARAEDPTDPEDAPRYAQYLRAKTGLCAGATPALVQERFGFLDQAIRAGNRNAMIDYRLEGPLGFEVDALDANDARLVEWKRTANAYLETLAAKGDRDAWSLLSTDYEMAIVADRNDAAAIKYETAILATSRRPDTDPLSVNFIATIARRLGPDATQRALEDGRALARAFPARR